MATIQPPTYLRTTAEGVVISIKVQPRASANEIGEPLGDELRVRVTAPPVDAAANEMLVRFLAESLGCPRNHVQLLKGQTSRHKMVLVHGMPAEAILARLSKSA